MSAAYFDEYFPIQIENVSRHSIQTGIDVK